MLHLVYRRPLLISIKNQIEWTTLMDGREQQWTFACVCVCLGRCLINGLCRLLGKVRAVVGLKAEDACQVYTVPGIRTRHTVLPDSQNKFFVSCAFITNFIHATREAVPIASTVANLTSGLSFYICSFWHINPVSVKQSLPNLRNSFLVLPIMWFIEWKVEVKPRGGSSSITTVAAPQMSYLLLFYWSSYLLYYYFRFLSY